MTKRPKQEQIPVTILNESLVVDTYFLYAFLRKLTTPFNKTKAFELGIIDEKGKVLRRRSQLRTTEERSAFTIFDTLVFNLKKLIERLPFGRTRLASYAAALWLLKEEQFVEYYEKEPKLLEESFLTFWDAVSIDFPSKNVIINLYEYVERSNKRLITETPVNNVGSGNIAGTTLQGDDRPVVRKKKKILKRKKKEEDVKKVDTNVQQEERMYSFKQFRDL